jgi:hypothetical protein
MTAPPTTSDLVLRLLDLGDRIRRVPPHRRHQVAAQLDRLERLLPDDTDVDPMDMVR